MCNLARDLTKFVYLLEITSCGMAKKGNKRAITRVPRSISDTNAIHTVTRMWTGNVPKAASDTGTFRSFNLNTFPTSDIVSLFQDYRFKSIKVEYLLTNAPNNNADFPAIITAPTHYNVGGVTPGNRDEVLQYRGTKIYQMGPSRVQYERKFVPYIQVLTSGSGIIQSGSQWLTTQTGSVPHLTHVEWIDRYNSTSSPTHTVQIVVTAVIECRGTR